MGSSERSWSKTLFGNQHLLGVSCSIAQGRFEFAAPELEADTGLSPSSVHRVLGVLCAVGLIARLARAPGERTQLYRRNPQPFWNAVLEMRQTVEASTDLSDVEQGVST